MPVVRFTWSPTLVDVRRRVCPHAQWNPRKRTWTMSEREAKAFLMASHASLDFVRSHTEISIDDVRWTIGFARGAPCRTEDILPSIGQPSVEDLIAATNAKPRRMPF